MAAGGGVARPLTPPLTRPPAPTPTQAAGWRDRAELVELAGPQLARRARGAEAGEGEGEGEEQQQQQRHAALLEAILPPYAPLETGAVKAAMVEVRGEDRGVCVATSLASPLISPTSPPHLPYIYPTSPLHLACISPAGARRGQGVRGGRGLRGQPRGAAGGSRAHHAAEGGRRRPSPSP